MRLSGVNIGKLRTQRGIAHEVVRLVDDDQRISCGFGARLGDNEPPPRITLFYVHAPRPLSKRRH